ncbi:DUF6572 domain-containing protein [Paenibacillus harenae]|uniref:Branched-chain amino acid ABC transporter substrate-binding protein n=1 Tax=Paenibacillus harenae TaxID=306543 RepID=A0ABT9TW68_PAEHA|nr:DUF6572 domain-containing protein [Paenibacillus harenae]MDQ0110680.1 hypothetical protein [Paenibacillus harenae]
MSLYDTNTIDAIGIDKEKGCATLALIDSEDWVKEEQHLLLLQEKLNSYMSFIESGEINTSYREAEGKDIEIVIHFKNDIPQSCIDFLVSVKEIIKDAGFMFSYYVG